MKRIAVFIGLMIFVMTSDASAWWSATVLSNSTHHKITDDAISKLTGTSYVDMSSVWFGKDDISNWTSGPKDDAAAHGGTTIPNDGSIEKWWQYAQDEYKSFNFASGDGSAYYYISLMMHLVEDQSVPAHAYNIRHGGELAYDGMETMVNGKYVPNSYAAGTADETWNRDAMKYYTRDAAGYNDDSSSWHKYWLTGPAHTAYIKVDGVLTPFSFDGAYGGTKGDTSDPDTWKDVFPTSWDTADGVVSAGDAEKALTSDLLGQAAANVAAALMAISKSLPPLINNLAVSGTVGTDGYTIIDLEKGSTITFSAYDNRSRKVSIYLTVDDTAGTPLTSLQYDSSLNHSDDYGVFTLNDLTRLGFDSTKLPYEGSFSATWDGKLADGTTPTNGQHALFVKVVDEDNNDTLFTDSNGDLNTYARIYFSIQGPPQVSSTSPVDKATNVSQTSPITISFSKDMNQATATDSSIDILPKIFGKSFSWSNNRTLIVNPPPSGFAADTTYAVTVSDSLKDTDGMKLDGDMDYKEGGNYTFSFITGLPPTVTSTSPANNATDVDRDTSISISFSAEMDKEITKVAISISPSLEEPSYTWAGQTLIIDDAYKLDENTTYTVTVSDSATNTAGTQLDGDNDGKAGGSYSFSFTTNAHSNYIITSFGSDYFDGATYWVKTGTKSLTVNVVDDNGKAYPTTTAPQLSCSAGAISFTSPGTGTSTWNGQVEVGGGDGPATFSAMGDATLSGITDFSIDTTPPTLTGGATNAPSCACPYSPIAFQFNATDAGSGVADVVPAGLGLYANGCYGPGDYEYGALSIKDNVGNSATSITGSISIPEPPGCDEPDDNASVSGATVLSLGNSDPITGLAVLQHGFYSNFNQQMVALNRTTKDITDANLAGSLIGSTQAFVIPSGGLYGRENSSLFKTELDEFVKEGGTLVVFAQQHGYEYAVLPVPQEPDGTYITVSGYGWTEDQACQYRSSYIDTWHQVFAGQSSSTPSVNVDGYFMDYPSTATVLLRRVANGQPALITYSYGKGQVIVTTLYSDFAYGFGQASADEKALVRDMITWARKPAQLLELSSSATLTTPLTATVTNDQSTNASSVSVRVLTPDKSQILLEQTTTVSLQSGLTQDLAVPFSLPTTTLGIYHTDYILYDASGNVLQTQREADSGRFVVSSRPSNTYTSPDFSMSVQSNSEVYTYGSPAIFTFNLWNRTNSSRQVKVTWGLPHHFPWNWYDEFNNTIALPANSEASFTYTLPAVTGYDRLRAIMYDDTGKRVGYADAGIWMIEPSATSKVSADKNTYGKGDTIPINTTISNNIVSNNSDISIIRLDFWNPYLGALRSNLSSSWSGDAKIVVTDPSNALLLDDVRPISMASHATYTILSSLNLPDDAAYGTYTITASISSGGRLVSMATSSFELPQLWISVTPTLPGVLATGFNAAAFQVRNSGTINVNSGQIAYSLTDPDGRMITSGSQSFALATGTSTTLTSSFVLPDLKFGTYSLTYTQSDETKTGQATTITIPNTVTMSPAFDKVSYQMRETANLTVNLVNTGQFALDNAMLTVSAPDAGYEINDIVSFATTTTVLTMHYAIPIPATVTAGSHDVYVILTLPSGSYLYQTGSLVIPAQAVAATYSGPTALAAGSSLSFELANTGGVDTNITGTVTLKGKNVAIYQKALNETCSAGTSSTHNFTIQNQAAAGAYVLNIAGMDAQGIAFTFEKQLSVNGQTAALVAKMDKEVYFSTENENAISNLNNIGATDIVDGTLSVKVVTKSGAPYIGPVPTEWYAFSQNAFSKQGVDYYSRCYNCYLEGTLPFPFTLEGTTFTRFTVSSNGGIELLPDNGAFTLKYEYGDHALVIADHSAATMIFASLDALSADPGYFGFKQVTAGQLDSNGRTIPEDAFVFYWETAVEPDVDCGTNYFEVMLYPDGRVQWNFDQMKHCSYEYEMYSGIYNGRTGTNLEAGRDLVNTSLAYYPTSNAADDKPIIQAAKKAWMPFTREALDSDGMYSQCDDCFMQDRLPFTIRLQGTSFTRFTMSSNGSVELLPDEGDFQLQDGYGTAAEYIAAYPDATMLFASFDDLVADGDGYFGYMHLMPGALDANGTIVDEEAFLLYWTVQTYDDTSPNMNYFEILLNPDGRMQWNLGKMQYQASSYDMYSGFYNGRTGTNLEIGKGLANVSRLVAPPLSWGTAIYSALLPINQQAGSAQDITSNIGVLPVAGKLYLQEELKNSLGQFLAKAEYQFYIVSGKTALLYRTDKTIYKPGETVVITGEVRNFSSIDATSLITAITQQKPDGTTETIYTGTLNVPASGSQPFTATMIAGNVGMVSLSGTVTQNDSLVAESDGRYEVSLPLVTMTVTVPQYAGDDPFSINVELNNSGSVDATVQYTALKAQGSPIDNQNITIAAGEAALLNYSAQITGDASYQFSIAGDASQTATKTVWYGYGDGIQFGIADGGVYPEGNLAIPMTLSNTGSLDETVPVLYRIYGPSGLISQETRTYYFFAGGSINDTLNYSVKEGSYQFAALSSAPDAAATVNIDVLKAIKSEMTMSVGTQSSNDGTFPVTVNIKNTGYNTLAGSVRLTLMDGQGATAWNTLQSLASLGISGSQSLAFAVNPASLIPAAYTLTAELLDNSNATLGTQSTAFTVQGAAFQITQLPVYQAFASGQTGTFTFKIKNSGNQQGSASLRFKAYDLIDSTQTEWLKQGEELEVSFSFQMPDDLEAKDYFADYQMTDSVGKTISNGQVKYYLDGVNISVSASLDKQSYSAGDTAKLTLSIENQGTGAAALYARVSYNGYENNQTVSLAGSSSLVFDVPLTQITGEKLFYGIYQNSGRSIYLNSLYIYNAGDAIVITTNKQVYNPGETMAVSITSNGTGSIGRMALSGPNGYSETFDFKGLATRNMPLPSVMVGGTYQINAQLATGSTASLTASHPIDVSGIQVKIIEATLDKSKYSSTDTVNANLTMTSNSDFNVKLKAWVVDPLGNKSAVVDQTVALSSAEPVPASLSTAFTTTTSGMHRLVYYVYNGDTPVSAGAESFDVGDAALLAVTTDKSSYLSSAASYSLAMQFYGTTDATIELQLDGTTITTTPVTLSGYSALNSTLGAVQPGTHVVKGILTSGGLTSTQEASFTVSAADVTPPATLLSVGNPKYVTTSTTYVTAATQLSLSATDDISGVAKTEYRVDGGTWTTASTFTVTTEGDHTVDYRSQDKTGNLEDARSLTLRVDNTAPTSAVTIGAPTASAANGTQYAAKNSVFQITATDTLSGVGKTEYRVDSGAWMSGSAFTLSNEGKYQIDYRSQDFVTNTEATRSLTVSIDNTAPTGSISINNNAAYANTTSVQLSIGCNDSASGCSLMQFSPDGSTWSSAEPFASTKTWFLSSGDGSKTVYVQYVDAVGNKSAAICAYIELDATAPTTTASPSAGTYNASLSVALATNESATIYYTVDGTIPTSASPLYSGPLVISETTTIRYFATDAAGNSEAVKSATYTIDRILPSLSLSTLPDGGFTNNATLNIAGTATDNVAVQGVTINGIAVTLNPDSTFNSVVTLVTGSNTITTIATDSAGNTVTDARTITFDQTAPNITISSPADNSVFSSLTVTITGITDKTVTAIVSVNSGPSVTAAVNAASFSQVISLETNTLNTIMVYATDLAGNTSSAKRTVMNDEINPALAIMNPVQDIITNQPIITLQGTVVDLTIVTVLVTDGTNTYAPEVTNGTFQQQLMFTDEKTYAVLVSATDAAGNATTIQRNIIYDIMPPDTTITSGPSALTNTTTAVVTFTSTESGSTFACALDSGTYGECANPMSYTGLTDGTHTFQVAATDPAENVDPTPASYTWTVDTIPPLATITGTPAGTTKITSALLKIAGEDVVSYKYQLDIGLLSAETATTTPIALTGLMDGTHKVFVMGKDSAGNWQTAANASTASWIVDTQVPTLVISALQNNALTNNATMNVAGKATDNVAVQGATINTNSVLLNADGTFSEVVSLNTGSNTITTEAFDTAGNTATDIRTIILDQTAPIITIASPADNSVTNKADTAIIGTIDKEALTSVLVNGSSPIPAIDTAATFSFPVTLAYGQNTIQITATDPAGNIGTAKRTVTLDNVNPVLSITSPIQDISTNQSGILLQGTVTDLDHVTVAITLDNTTYMPPVTNGMFQQQLTLTDEKTYTVTVTAVDAAGNATTVQRNIIYDKTPPTLAINPVASPTNNNTQTVNGIRETGSTVSVTCTAATVGVVSYPTSTTWQTSITNMTEGGNTISATSTDLAANISDPVTATITLDTHAPMTTASPTAGAYTMALTAILTPNEQAKTYYTIDGTTPTTGSAVYSTPIVVSASTTIKYFSVDTVGNSETLKSVAYTISTTTKKTSALTYTGPALINQGGSVTLTATLKDGSNAPNPSGQTITFTLGSQSCSGTVDATGNASCSISAVSASPGQATVTTTFSGDSTYLSSSDADTVIVYAYPSTGAFVVGDKNAVMNSSVTFWGSQWFKNNTLSSGSAPSSFKGYADSLSSNPASCGATWTANPGNSSNPPSSVPAYMAVLVANSIAKSGSTISGITTEVVIVKTDSGYSSNSGHGGTGTVVGVVCASSGGCNHRGEDEGRSIDGR